MYRKLVEMGCALEVANAMMIAKRATERAMRERAGNSPLLDPWHEES